MLDAKRISRRAILRLASALGLAGMVPAFAASTEGVALAALSADDAKMLLAVCRTLFPHDFLADDPYMKVVVSIDAQADGDSAVLQSIRAGLSGLPGNFAALTEADREAQLGKLEGSPFFQLAYDETLSGLYRDADIARMLGNEGSSIEFGGFIDRGFDDIDWLPLE